MSVLDVLQRRRPERIVYAPNYWQWFAHHRNHGLLPPEAAHCRDQLALIEGLGLDVFSRNIYCDERRGWWGGLCEETWNGGAREWTEGRDLVIERTYGRLTERLRYLFAESTLVQEKYAVDDYANQLDELEALLRTRRWRFVPERFAALQERVGPDGVVVAGELIGPLKMLYVLLGPQDATYCLMDYPERVKELLALHEAAQLDLVRQMAGAGVRVMMAMDNLDTAFHPPYYVEQYSASFYERASRICHEHGAIFFIHACGHQRDNLALIASLGVDGLEGVAFPTLGDVELDEAMRLSGERMILTGGISAQEFERLRTREAVFAYVRELFGRMRPYAHRFMFSASCNTPYTAPWQTLLWFRAAWREYAG
ncbi:MAG TPA: uroporphyrinogen decarboxylase family protein [Kiritimatiellia bacterium]|nr:uroporphyrinogen decarboxylase family protein [Kiritimatiellia bacterium]HRR32922.1 uroporphyrinogen decarboxylase family protein [Kiritimatiellia bacterium]